MKKTENGNAQYTPVAPTPYFLSHPYSSPENKLALGSFRDRGDMIEGKSTWDAADLRGASFPRGDGPELLTSRSAGEAESQRSFWSSPRRLGSSALDDSHLLASSTRSGSERSTPLSLESPKRAALTNNDQDGEREGRRGHMRNNSQGLSGSHSSIVAKHPNGRPHRGLSHISSEEIALVPSAHQTAISGFNLYAPGSGYWPEESSRRRQDSSPAEPVDNETRRGHRRGRRNQTDSMGASFSSTATSPYMLRGQPTPSRSDHVSCQARNPIQAPMSASRRDSSLTDPALLPLVPATSPAMTTPTTTNSGHCAMIIQTDGRTPAPAPAGRRRSASGGSSRSLRRRGVPSSSSLTQEQLGFTSTSGDDEEEDGDDEGEGAEHRRINSLIRYGDSQTPFGSSSDPHRRTWSGPASTSSRRSSFAFGRNQPCSPAPSRQSYRSTTTYRSRAVSDPWGVTSTARYSIGSKAVAGRGSSSHKRGNSFFERLRRRSVNFLIQMGLLSPPAGKDAAPPPPPAPSARYGSRSQASTPSGRKLKNSKQQQHRPASAGSLEAVYRGSNSKRQQKEALRLKAGGESDGNESEGVKMDRLLGQLNCDDCPPEIINVFVTVLEAMVRRLQSLFERTDVHESDMAAALTEALEGSDQQGMALLQAAIASKASQQVSVVAGLAVTALGYITGVRALRKAMVRHTSKTGVTFLEDLAQLAVSHADSSGPVFVDSLHVMTELLKDPVLREEALRAIPPGLTDHVRRYRKHLNPGSAESGICTTFLRVAPQAN